jgi:hypothetical protein
MDTWILLCGFTPGQDVTRRLSILKSRGMPHSAEERPFVITNRGLAAKSAVPPRRGRTS